MLTWFYLSGLMLLLGGEVNSEIEAAATERKLRAQDVIAHQAPEAITPPLQRSA